MMFMAEVSRVGANAFGSANGEWRIASRKSIRERAAYYSLFATPYSPLHPRHIELRLLAGAVAAQRAGLADRVGTLKDPVLPRRQAGEDFRFHGLRSDEAQVGFHAGQAVGREAGALLEKHPDLVVPVDIVEREGDEAERFGLLRIECLTNALPRAQDIFSIGLKARLQPRQAVAHRVRPEIHRGQLDGRRRAVVALPRTDQHVGPV